jgi:microcystin-dependent protein
MATVTASYNWVSGETVTPAKLNSTAAPTVVVADNEVTTSKILDGAVTLAKLVTAVQQALLPAGAVQAFAMNSAPSGWLAADGTAVSRSTYAALFAAISTTYGAGDGSTTFALPDLRGIFVRGSGSQTISGTTYNKTFAAKEGDAIRNITGNLSFGAQMAALQTASGAFAAVTTNQYMPQQATANTLGIGSVNFSATAAGVPTSDENRPANIALLYCIKF